MLFLACPNSKIQFPEQNFCVLLESFLLMLVTAAPDRWPVSLCAALSFRYNLVLGVLVLGIFPETRWLFVLT